jgi:ribonuclease HII
VNEVTLDEERKYWDQGCTRLAGIDEAGRGPLAGPVVCAAVIFPKNIPFIPGINDSKKLSRTQREYLFPLILRKALEVTVCIIDESVIDTINIHHASLEGMKSCIDLCVHRPEIILVDGWGFNHEDLQIVPIIRGDAKVMTIAAASIVAKVTRDDIMYHYHQKYCEYGFNKNSGYPTRGHKEAITRFGLLPIHRRSFKPVKSMMK